jgi:hypothetical protein
VVWIALGAGAFILVLAIVGVTLWATRVSSEGTIGQPAVSHGLNAEQRPPKSNDKQNVSGSEPANSKPKAAVSGELFVTTKAGDVKKGAGQKVYFTPITPEFEKSVSALLAKVDEHKADSHRIVEDGWKKYGLKELNPLSWEYEQRLLAFDREYQPHLSKVNDEFKGTMRLAMVVLTKDSSDVVADGEGKFKLNLPVGKYVLWTHWRSLAHQEFAWCKVVEIRDAPLNLIFSEDSVFLYSPTGLGIGWEDDPTYQRLQRIASELAKR